MWLAPPFMKSQMTLFARGAAWGLPSGGAHGFASWPQPSRWSTAPRAQSAKPMTVSARNARRLVHPQSMDPPLSDRDEFMMVQQRVDEAAPLSRRQELQAGLVLVARGGPAQHRLEGGGNERLIDRSGLREGYRQRRARGARHRAVEQRQRLLRDDGRGAGVALRRGSGVEDRQKLHPLFRIVAEIETPAAGDEALPLVEVPAAPLKGAEPGRRSVGRTH